MERSEEKDSPASPGAKPGPARERLDPDEVRIAIERLTLEEKVKLHVIERRLLWGTGMGPGELLNETFCKALLGDRVWPRDVPLMACIVMNMKSHATHARAAQAKEELREPEVVANAAEEGPGPEDALAHAEAKAALEKIEAALGDDENARMVVLGWSEGLRGKPLRDFVGCDQATLDYAIRRVRKAAITLYPDGSPL